MKYFVNFLRLFAGLFIADKHRTIAGKIWQIISRFSWEILQTSAGFMCAFFMVMTGKCKNIFFGHGATVLQCKGKFGGFTLGSFIIGDHEIDADPQERLFQHEYGHYLQSMASGPLYLLKYGLPSLVSAWRYDFYTHCKSSVEADANLRAIAFWNSNYQQKFKWDYKYNPIYKGVAPVRIRWYDFVPVYFPLVHLVKALRK